MKQNDLFFEKAICSWTADSERLFNSPSETAKSAYFYMQEVGYFKTVYPYLTERKNLPSFLIVYTLSGSGKLNYLEKDYTLRAGDAFFINCTEHHSYQCMKETPWEMLWVHFNGAQVLGYYNEFIKNGFELLHFNEESTFVFSLRQLLEYGRASDVTSEIKISLLIHTLLSECILQNLSPDASRPVLPEEIQKARIYIEQRYQSDLCLDDIASHCNLSKYYLSNRFKKYIGIPMNEYLITVRLSHAKELLQYSNQTVSQIAFQIGFNHISHFISLFKAREGLPPNAYRKTWRG